MENASKALIIAGAILVSILLISVGIIIMNAISNPVQSGADSADSMAIDNFNGKFTSFQGVQKGSVIRDLLGKIQSSNATDEFHQISLTSTTPAANLTMATINPSRQYTVTLIYCTELGAGARGNVANSNNNLLGGAAANHATENGYIREIEVH